MPPVKRNSVSFSLPARSSFRVIVRPLFRKASSRKRLARISLLYSMGMLKISLSALKVTGVGENDLTAELIKLVAEELNVREVLVVKKIEADKGLLI